MENNLIINVGRQVCAGGLEIGRLLAKEFNFLGGIPQAER